MRFVGNGTVDNDFLVETRFECGVSADHVVGDFHGVFVVEVAEFQGLVEVFAFLDEFDDSGVLAAGRRFFLLFDFSLGAVMALVFVVEHFFLFKFFKFFV